MSIHIFSSFVSSGVSSFIAHNRSDPHVWADSAAFIAICSAEIAHFSTYGLIAPIDADQDGVADLFGGIEDQCPGTTIPELVPINQLGINRWALVNTDTVFDTNTATRINNKIKLGTFKKLEAAQPIKPIITASAAKNIFS